MSDSVKLRDLYIGVPDGAAEAKNEKFEELFYDPDNKYDELMKNKEKFIILGNKGTGKTYLANYVMKKANKRQKPKIIDASEFWIYKLSNLDSSNLPDDILYALCKWFFLIRSLVSC